MRTFLLIIAIGTLIMTPLRSFAAEEKFFEFATDVGVPIEIPTGSIAIQEFKVHNDYINAIDLWFDNAGSSGSATVTFLDSSNAVLTSKSVTIAPSDPFYTGQQLHVRFSKTVGITSGSWYKIRITSNAPKLRLYGVKRVQFVEHDAPYPIDSSVGGSSVNGESQIAVFKFALYEETDAEAPIITNASSTISGPDTMQIAFNANELVDRMVSYTRIGSGIVPTIGYTGNYSICFEDIFACPLTIDTQRDALYTYRLTVRDSWGNEAFFDGAFESWKPGTPVPPADPTVPFVAPPAEAPSSPTESPVVSVTITDARIVALAYNSVQLSWNTNKAANSSLVVSTDPVGAQVVSTVTTGVYELVHTISTGKGIAAGINYYATIISRDEAGSMAAQVLPFTAPKAGADAPPAVPEGSSTPTETLQTSVLGEQGLVSIVWDPLVGGEPSNGYRIDIIDAQGNLIESRTVAPGTYAINVDGLAGGEYRVLVYADEKGVVEKVAAPATVVIPKRAEPIDTYELIKRPIVYIPSILFALLILGLAIYSRVQKKIPNKK
ncbi:MAG: hypothetical protein UY19_C0005G0048 [Candidatus Wolfebacteria bacterium GW2011_GWA2_47_9b]|uniref:Uncharacterized protein n=1 Tax=Candidatus Wolfebacteria bacterium GW2011_GWA2_47_9b TaxID=1619005 RepID=A0A0G1X774_9BACT|nr:MAG: hypothetical protein UY19_C0005G0048 [Candidatus Wolfebacteria bacterium GW2011_GWA2_47_9b]